MRLLIAVEVRASPISLLTSLEVYKAPPEFGCLISRRTGGYLTRQGPKMGGCTVPLHSRMHMIRLSMPGSDLKFWDFLIPCPLTLRIILLEHRYVRYTPRGVDIVRPFTEDTKVGILLTDALQPLQGSSKTFPTGLGYFLELVGLARDRLQWKTLIPLMQR